MTFLFLIFTIAIVLLWAGYRKTALMIALINILLCLAMFWYHVTDKLKIML